MEAILLYSADSKRQKGQEILKDSYLTHQAASFADRQAEQHLREAQKVLEICTPTTPAMLKHVCLPALLLPPGHLNFSLVIAVQQGSWLANHLLGVCISLKAGSNAESMAEDELKCRCVKRLTGGGA